jgi:hypothetical protein
VSGAKTTAYAVIEVLTARFTPSGTLIRWVKSGFSPWVTACPPKASSHSKRAWSLELTVIVRVFGSRHIPLVTQKARATAASTSSRSARRFRVAGAVEGPVATDGEDGTQRTLPTGPGHAGQTRTLTQNRHPHTSAFVNV